MPRPRRQGRQRIGVNAPLTPDEKRFVRPSECLTFYGSEAAAQERYEHIAHELHPRHPLHWVGGSLEDRRAFWNAVTPRYRALHLDDRQLAGEAHRHTARYTEDGQLLMPPGPPPACCDQEWLLAR